MLVTDMRCHCECTTGVTSSQPVASKLGFSTGVHVLCFSACYSQLCICTIDRLNCCSRWIPDLMKKVSASFLLRKLDWLQTHNYRNPHCACAQRVIIPLTSLKTTFFSHIKRCQGNSHLDTKMVTLIFTMHPASDKGRSVSGVFSEAAAFRSYGVNTSETLELAYLERVCLLCVSWRDKKSQRRVCIDSRMQSTAVASQCQTPRANSVETT